MKKMIQRGFTLIELLVVIGILAVLLAITLVAINPARQFAQANNTKRSGDVNAILNAINQYQTDNAGSLPAGITGVAQNIANTGADICTALVPTYIAQLPVDPTINNGTALDAADCAAAYDSGYTVVQGASDNRITVAAPNAELSATIQVTR